MLSHPIQLLLPRLFPSSCRHLEELFKQVDVHSAAYHYVIQLSESFDMNSLDDVGSPISSSFLACCALLLLDIAAADSEVTTIVDA